MPVWDWITHRTELVGWESWTWVARYACLSREQCVELQLVDDLRVLRREQVALLARALCTGPKQLRRIDAGEIVDTPVHRDLLAGERLVRADPEGFFAENEWPPRPRREPGTPTLGVISWPGRFEPIELDPVPLEYGAPGSVFGLRTAAGDRTRIFRLVGRERFRDGEDVAVYLYNDFDGEGLIGRACVVGSDVFLQLDDNSRLPIDPARVARLAKETASYPPPLGGVGPGCATELKPERGAESRAGGEPPAGPSVFAQFAALKFSGYDRRSGEDEDEDDDEPGGALGVTDA